ncbi:DUF2946 family protein [Uliginosibacterium gangwonense]|uniref:DUF2946 family protein n=1 Tax=Uliginosibacterium gangwonense TaxID=392736 RepID=UPI00146AC95E
MPKFQPIRACPRQIIWLAILAVFCHGLMPLWMAFPIPSGVLSTLCSASGARQILVSLDDDSSKKSPAPGSPAPNSPLRCPLCLAGAHLALNALPNSDGPLATAYGHILHAAVTPTPDNKPRWNLQSPRAPPAASV